MASRCDKPFLPFEIIINILKRLPVKSIVRFQCVCKEWKNLFQTPSFIVEHLDHSDRKNPFLLLHEWTCEREGSIYTSKHWYHSLSLLDHKMKTIEVLRVPSIGYPEHSLEIIGSCNGLLCVQVDHDPHGPTRSLWLWNPAIREVREVPETPNDWRVGKVGFGFSSVVNDYKIVRFYTRELYRDMIDGVEVYSLSTGSWKELESGALHISAALAKAVNVDGTIFWLHNDHVVVSFDIATEVATLTQLPTGDGIYPIGLSVHENKLVGHYGFIEEDGRHSICVWVMKEVASESGKSFSCTQKYRIEQVPNFLVYNFCFWRNEMVCPGTKYITEEEGDQKCVLHMFNLNTNEEREFNCSTFCNVQSQYTLEVVDRQCDVFNYEKSLVSVWNNQIE